MAGRYKIEFLPSAARELEALPREAQGRVADAIEALADAPRPSAAKFLSGTGRDRLLVRACYAEGRRERRWAPNLRILPIDEPTADGDLSSVVDRDQLERGFRRLSIEHRMVVILHHYLDLPLERVADILGIPVGTAHSRLHHALRGLRAALDADSRAPVREVI